MVATAAPPLTGPPPPAAPDPPATAPGEPTPEAAAPLPRRELDLSEVLLVIAGLARTHAPLSVTVTAATATAYVHLGDRESHIRWASALGAGPTTVEPDLLMGRVHRATGVVPGWTVETCYTEESPR